MAGATGLKLKSLGAGVYETQCAKIRVFKNGREWVAIEKATGNRVCYATLYGTLRKELSKKMSDEPRAWESYGREHGLKYALRLGDRWWWKLMWEQDENSGYLWRSAIVEFFPSGWEIHFFDEWIVSNRRITKQKYDCLCAYIAGLNRAGYFEE